MGLEEYNREEKYIKQPFSYLSDLALLELVGLLVRIKVGAAAVTF